MTAVITIVNKSPVSRIFTNSFRGAKTFRSITKMSNCIFCKIISGDAPAEIFHQDDKMIIFKDIKPASKHHFLAVPKEHIPNVNSLSKNQIPLINDLIAKSKQVLADKGGNLDDTRLGFHLPPFNSVSHLHLHIISPVSEMSFISSFVFKPNSWWFTSVDQILEKLEKSKL
ncbi:adenosine 5'-monophosphoramidase HINT3 [Tribolium castaneum]|nr:PREDICTED: histidine triad nucleotide-binding protein 3 [Tribolium castaneum]|eukprot:XP_008191122.1 PREDICTED: histidine triad nucleotide-binding protein 3 [Tribolium castaneum]